jgi:hypothetical protein
VDFSIKIKFNGHFAVKAFWRLGRISRVFFISMPPKALPGAGFGKPISQNLVFKELRFKILITNGLKWRVRSLWTVTASTMIAQVRWRAQG